jgi:hypothetical protein
MERKRMEAPPKTSRKPHILKHGTEKSVFLKDVLLYRKTSWPVSKISPADESLTPSPRVAIITIAHKK